MRPPRVRKRIRATLAVASALIAAAAAVTVGLNAAGAEEEAETTDVEAADTLVWSDEFNSAAGTAPDSSKWSYDTGGGGWGNNEYQYYTTSTSNAAHDGNGNMVITAREENPSGYSCWYGTCQYTSARLLTKNTFTQEYGRFEARIQIPEGQGIWPAFWMLGDDLDSVGWPQSGEIDIMENIGSEPSTVHGTIHGPGYSGSGGLTSSDSLSSGAFADGFHTFAVEWTSTSISWEVDGVVYSTKTTADTGSNEWVFDHPFFMILNVAVGGNWPGYPDDTTQFPQTMKIDYVRVYSIDDSSSSGGQITGMDGKCLDVEAAGTANGTPVQVYTCNGTDAQKWTFASDGTLRALGKCLDVAGGSTADGTKVQLWTCNGTAAQQWVLSSANDIVNPQADKCLDVSGANSADGTNLQIAVCNGTSAQKWYPA